MCFGVLFILKDENKQIKNFKQHHCKWPGHIVCVCIEVYSEANEFALSFYCSTHNDIF